jgi:HEAT repeat protein
VRQAATLRLAELRDPKCLAAVTARLSDDSWPLVRAQAAASLSELPANPNVDQRLSAALDDQAWVVRVAAADALGKRQALSAAEVLLDHFEDRDERFEVRIAAANSLGELCYEDALASLTEQANKLAATGMDLRDRAIAASALNALGAIHPEDLARRLEPLLNGKDVKAEVRAAARAAVASRSRCRAAKPPTTTLEPRAARDDQGSLANDS